MQLSLLLLIALTLITLAACASRAEEQLQQRRLRHRTSIAHLRRGKHSEEKQLDDEEEDEEEEQEQHDYAEYVDASEAAATGAAAADHSLTASSAPPGKLISGQSPLPALTFSSGRNFKSVSRLSAPVPVPELTHTAWRGTALVALNKQTNRERFAGKLIVNNSLPYGGDLSGLVKMLRITHNDVHVLLKSRVTHSYYFRPINYCIVQASTPGSLSIRIIIIVHPLSHSLCRTTPMHVACISPRVVGHVPRECSHPLSHLIKMRARQAENVLIESA